MGIKIDRIIKLGLELACNARQWECTGHQVRSGIRPDFTKIVRSGIRPVF